MKESLGVALAAGALAAALAPGVASAAPPDHANGKPIGTCPDNWLMGQPQPGHVGLLYDTNGDTWVCLLLQNSGGGVFKDNTLKHNK